MTYTPHVWVNDETITADLLNNLETAVSEISINGVSIDTLEKSLEDHTNDFHDYTNAMVTNINNNVSTIVNQLNSNIQTITYEINSNFLELKNQVEDTNVYVTYTDIATDDNPGRKGIVLKNHDTILGYTNDNSATYNIAMISKWNKVDLGTSSLELNLNALNGKVTVNDSMTLATTDDLSKLEAKITELEQKIASLQTGS